MTDDDDLKGSSTNPPLPSSSKQPQAQGEGQPKVTVANNDENDGCRANTRLIALSDTFILVLVMVGLVVVILENTVVGDPECDWKNHETIIRLAVYSTAFICILLEPLFAFGLMKSTKPTTEQREALTKIKLWLWYSTFLQILTAVVVTISFLYGRTSVGSFCVGIILIRMAFIIVVFRFLQELNPRGMCVAVGPAPVFTQQENNIPVDNNEA